MMFKKLQRFFTGTLHRQLTTGMVLTVVSMMAYFVWDMNRYQADVAFRQQAVKAVDMARSAAVTSAIWVASRDVSGLHEIVQGLSALPDVRHAVVLDTQGQILAHNNMSLRGQFMTDLPTLPEAKVLQNNVQLVDVISPVVFNGRPIGWVRLGLSGQSLENQLFELTRGSLLHLLMVLAISLVFATLVSRYLTRRLHAIQHVALAVQAGQAGLRVAVHGDDEAAQLARQFNDMLNTLAQRDQALKDSELFKEVILDSVAAEVAAIDRQGVIRAVNEQWQRFSLDNSDRPGQPASGTGIGINYLDVCRTQEAGDDTYATQARDGILAVLDGRMSRFSLVYPCHSPEQQRWFTMVVRTLGLGQHGGAAITHTDVSAVKQAEQYEMFRSHILEMMAGDAALPDLLHAMVSGVESMHPAMLCSVLLLSDDGRHLAHGAAPSLPDFYNEAIDGAEIGLGHGSCGTAAYTGERVIVEDVASHPYWVNYLDLAQRAGLGACWSQPVFSSTGQVLGTFAIYHRQAHSPSDSDIAMIIESARLASIAIEHKQTQAALRASEDTFRTLFETAPVGVLYQNADGKITAANPAAQRILGLTLDQLQGRTSMDPRWRAIHEDGSDFPGDQHPIMVALRTGTSVHNTVMGVSVPDRDMVWILVSATPLFKNGKVSQAYVVFEDITERHQMQQQVRQLAFYDPLTQLPNRRLLTEHLSQAMVACKRNGTYGAMMFLDLDNFKPLNDQHGHEAGDLLLVEVAQRLKNCVRGVDTVARIGGDEFVVMLTDLHVDATESTSQALHVAEKIRASLAQPYLLTVGPSSEASALTVEHHCTASIGVALFSQHDTHHERILQRADAAMYQAKDEGRNRVKLGQMSR